jgi:hypothetical protein
LILTLNLRFITGVLRHKNPEELMDMVCPTFSVGLRSLFNW